MSTRLTEPKHYSPFISPSLQSLSYYRQIVGKIPKKENKDSYRIAIISTFTTTGLSAVLQTLCHEIDIPVTIYETPYAQYMQEILNPKSNLYTYKPDIIFFLSDPKTIIPEFSDCLVSKKTTAQPINAFKHLSNLLMMLQKHTDAHIVCTNFTPPPVNYLGVFSLDYKQNPSSIVHDINRRLVKLSQKNSRIHIYDLSLFFMTHGYEQAHDTKLYFLGDYYIAPSMLPQLAYELMGYIKAIKGKGRKCIVLDLDNTLWGGVIGEDGIAGIKLGPTPPGNAYVHFQKILLTLYARGIILAINSANNYDDAMEVFEKHPHMILKKEHFAATAINWQNKSDNMQTLAKELNIGLDSMIFVDDDPKKRLLMEKMLPQVQTLAMPSDPSHYANALLSLNDFSPINLTKEDFSRGEKYYTQAKRRSIQKTSTNIDEYLKNLAIKVDFTPIDTFSIPRIAQLTQRTNQFNMTTRRYTEIDIEKFAKDKKIILYAAEVIDRFGSYGICAILIGKKSEKNLTIDTFLMSCRVLGMNIEQTLLHQLTIDAQKSGLTYIEGEFIPTAKNKPAQDVYKNAGFKKVSQNTDSTRWQYMLKTVLPKPPFVTITHS